MLSLFNELVSLIKSLLWSIGFELFLLIVDIFKNLYELFVGIFKFFKGE